MSPTTTTPAASRSSYTAAAAAAAPPAQEPLPHYVLPSVARSLRPGLLRSSTYPSGVLSAHDAAALVNAAAAATDTPACCSPPPSKIEGWAKQQSRGTFDERGDTQGGGGGEGGASAPDTNRLVAAASSSRVTFDGDFMGLRGYGEARVHSLFAPPFAPSSPPPRSSWHRKTPPSATARGLPGEQRRQGESAIGDKRPYPLPPIAVVLGISGGGTGRGNAAGIEAGSSATRGGGGGEEWKQQRGIVEGAEGFHATGLGDRSSSTASTSGIAANFSNNNGVFHAFLDLGRRLPRRLRRDREDQEA